MYARVATYEVAEERVAEVAASFDEAARKVQELEGLEGGVVLVGEEGTVMTITFWKSLSALEASETRASFARQAAAGAVNGEVKSVCHYEVTSELVPLAKLAAEVESAKG
jgi:heme-degrading monooxygenase HmoA